MKKLLVVLVVALLALALVACGGSDSTKPKATSASTPAATDPVNPGSDTTPNTGVESTPNTDVESTPDTSADSTPSSSQDDTPDTGYHPTEGVDILFGALEDMAIDVEFKKNGCSFEDKHPAHNYRNVFAIKVLLGDNGIVEDLIQIEDVEESYSPFEMNDAYKWVVFINDEAYEIDLFTYEHRITWGYVLCDLGDWDYDRDNLDENGQVAYDIKLEISDKETGKIKYWAWFTDPEWFGLHYYTPTDRVVMTPDPDRDKTHVAIPSDDATPLEGPVGNRNEPYTNLFDGSIRTKLCTPKGEQSGAIIWKYKEPQYVVSYSLIGANDDKKSPGRVPYAFTFYGSNDGENWVELDKQEFEKYTAAVSYNERNFEIADPDLYEYFKLEIGNDNQYQFSEIVLYTKVN